MIKSKIDFITKVLARISGLRESEAPTTTPSWEAGTKGMTEEQKEAEVKAFKERLDKYVPMREGKV